MVKRYSKINHYFAMNYHCPMRGTQLPIESTHHQVSSYVKAFVNTLVPTQMWGSVENKNIVFRGIDLFVRLRRFEDITLHQIMQGFQVLRLFVCFPVFFLLTFNVRLLGQVSKCAWTHPSSREVSHVAVQESRLRVTMASDYVSWVFNYLVVPLIKASFYVTESAAFAHRTTYYRHDIWNKLFKQSFATMDDTNFKKETQVSIPFSFFFSRTSSNFCRFVCF